MSVRSDLLRFAVLAPLRERYAQTLLAVVAIAIGVALGVAIHVVNRSAADEVSNAARHLFGRADLTVQGGSGGFDEELYPRVARLPGVRAVSPVVEIEARLPGRDAWLDLVGIDPFRAARMQPAFASVPQGGPANPASNENLYLSASAARQFALQAGEILAVQVGLQTVPFRIAAVLPASAFPQSLGIVDIAAAQWKLNRVGVLDRLDVQVASGADMGKVRAAIAAVLPAGVNLRAAREQGDEALQFSRAYRGNLTALALVALFTGGFLVYAMQAAAVMRRRRELALWHALGTTRGEQIAVLLCGGALIGLAGSATGVVLGIAIAEFALRSLAVNLGGGYFQPGSFLESGFVSAVHATDMTVFFALGVGVTLLATLRPALEAARLQTATALKSSDVDLEAAHGHAGLGVAAIAAATLLLFLPAVAGLPLPGYAAIALILVGAILLMPSFGRAVLRLMRAPQWPPAFIALAHLRGATRYALLSVTAILVSFSLMVAMAIMVASFRLSLDHWLQRLLPADLYLRAGAAQQSAFFDADSQRKLRALDGVERLEANRFAELELPQGGAPITVIARPIDEANAARILWLTRTGSVASPLFAANGPADGSSEDSHDISVRDGTPHAASDGAAGGEVAKSEKYADSRGEPKTAVPVWITEQLADRLHLEPGSRLELPLGTALVTCRVAGVWRDYELQNGSLVIDRATYIRLTGDERANTIWMWLRPGTEAVAVAGAVRNALPAAAEYDLRVPAEIRTLSLRAFDRTFAVTYLLELIAIVIGLMGIGTGMSAQVLARRAELGALRHIGVTRRQVAAMLLCEGAGLGLLGVIAGLATGMVLSLILIYVVNRQSFHWSMDLHVPVGTLAGLAVGLVIAAAATAVWSGRQAMRGGAVRAVKEDW